MPQEIMRTVAIYHTPTTTGAVSYPGTADATVTGGIVPLSSQRRAVMGIDNVGTFELFVDDDVDIREGDKIVVDPSGDNVEYRVNNVDVYDFGGLPHRDCVITRVES